ncbi:Capsular polysaccharide export system periplasmic protein KpsD [Sandaracinus amylolyticus]|uniref:Capsular polysaccharide export system periplasmic protein KpsD n=1 Tax=Sandaracinus amylolyticus TaxID=927083 RepID=A0A0F6YKW7_9BACT|nr:Capsular polysaccharide export system periplasmic protein KpsD [Sandaracinus amylolyticus]
MLPGDRVMVSAWGAVTVSEILTVDTQGNLFLPGVGPVRVAGVRNDELTPTVRAAMQRLYRGSFDVYTNLLNASPVAVFVTGGVRRPGRYAGIPSDSVLVFLDQAGGIEPEAGSYRRITVLRGGQPIAELDLYDFLLRGQLTTPQFEDGDVVLVGRRGPVIEVQPHELEPVLVELEGDGDSTGADVLEVIAPGARVDSVTVRGAREGLPTARTFAVSSFGDVRLRDGDIVTFRRDLQADFIVVRVQGEFLGHGEFAVARGTRLLDLLNYVPVDPELANVGAVSLRRRSVQAQQRQSLQESLDRLERAVLLAQSDTQGEAAIRRQEAEMMRTFVAQARRAQPHGIVVTSTAGRQVNVILEDGDVIVIPPHTNVVRIVGEVMMSQAVMFRPDLRVDDYVRMVGGYTDRANRGHIIVRRANAEIEIGGGDIRLQPGDEVIIPPNVDDKWLQNGIDLAQVIYQLAVAASVVIRTGL